MISELFTGDLCLSKDGLFLENGDQSLVGTICEVTRRSALPAPPGPLTLSRQCLDTGAEFPFHGSETKPETALAAGDTFIRLLKLLPEPIIPANLVARCTEVTNKDDAFQVRSCACMLFIPILRFNHLYTAPRRTSCCEPQCMFAV